MLRMLTSALPVGWCRTTKDTVLALRGSSLHKISPRRQFDDRPRSDSRLGVLSKIFLEGTVRLTVNVSEDVVCGGREELGGRLPEGSPLCLNFNVCRSQNLMSADSFTASSRLAILTRKSSVAAGITL